MTKTDAEWTHQACLIIRSGKADGALNKILTEVKARRKILAQSTFDDLKINDRVRFNNTTRPARMRGLEGTVVEKLYKKVVVEVVTSTDEGYPSSFRRVRTPVDLLERI